ncbi:cytochrome C [Solemya pervernicosa gill symbiont]|uniref:Cytochrome C n=2 Tax=Gammaproteobacteria incertae sedis TaxID=118884 RepID=A0A1T2L8Y8_9GAMM|nr:multiheme c-type cytochrome [Candidatus Reidiella endopervernicosa]OOZ41530.1 cytochrome C [Solemya pervernicosa gill symbiont]QKQ27935.1 cytochrome C [Candidatus Reidiella endopervernicosa]
MIKNFLSLLAALAVAMFLYSVYLHLEVGGEPHYVTSESCESCHQENYTSWKANTLHPYMFRPVKSDADILADFDNADPKVVTFDKSEIEYVVGNKWEQVYVRMIDGEYYLLPAKWYVIQKRWVPYKVKDWKETPMSYKCNGCHTTGFDPVTLKFSEFGIGCEACHGPGSTHVERADMSASATCAFCHKDDEAAKTLDHTIIRSVSASVCGQCHNRGTNTAGEAVHANKFNFPVNFSPDGDIEQAMQPSTPESDKKGKFWWGSGIAKNRHQEFSDWGKSKHASAHRKLMENAGEGDGRGELEERCLKCHSTDYRHAKPENRPTLDSAKYGVTCVACHEPHGKDRGKATQEDGTAKCAACHIDSMSHWVAERGETHYPCPTTAVGCADCHMPRMVKTGGFFSLRSHAFKVVPPDLSKGDKIPNSCQNGGCHEERTLEWAVEAFERHYPDIRVDTTAAVK